MPANYEIYSESDWQLQEHWNQTTQPFPAHRCLHELFEEQAQRTPQAIAVIYSEQHLSYQELDARANQVAQVLVEYAVGPDVVVGLCIERSLEMLIALLGILKAGGAYLPLDPDLPPHRLAQIIEGARSPLCLTQPHLRALLPQQSSTLIMDSNTQDIARASRTKPSVAVTSQHLVSVYYTSGSTGLPKGVANVHRGWVNRMYWIQQQHQLQPEETVLHKTTLAFDDAALEIFWPLMVGARIALIAPGLHRDPRAVLEAAIRYQIAYLQVVPSMLNMLLETIRPEESAALHHLRNVISSGEALHTSTVRQCQEKITAHLHNTWGVTEVSIDSTHHTCSEQDLQESGAVCVGKPLYNNEVYILDASYRPVQIGVTGDLYMAGAGLARGYLHDPQRTALAFVPNPFKIGERMYRTGDLGYFREDGSIKFVGRADHQVKIRGMRVELREIEEVLLKHPSVKEAVVLVQEVADDLKRLVAYVTSAKRTLLFSAEELREYVRKRLPDYMTPSFILILERFPLNTNGKIDHKQLPLPTNAREHTGTAFVQPEGPVEEALAEIWTAILKVTSLSTLDNFFDLGGHSLAATRLVERIHRRFGLELPLRVVFAKPTIKALGLEVEERLEEQINSMTEQEIQDFFKDL
ncbi:MAG TPA: amino acid adenylation domain-containing protein [Ktedonobacteraceae bacterium]|nr:amino acid adenylation domain-containing protein [Ktedonobacteraceae bacterium]